MPKRDAREIARGRGGGISPPSLRGVAVPLISNLSCLHVEHAKYVSKYVKLRGNGQFPFSSYARRLFLFIYNNEIITRLRRYKTIHNCATRHFEPRGNREESRKHLYDACGISRRYHYTRNGPFDSFICVLPLSFLSRKLFSAESRETLQIFQISRTDLSPLPKYKTYRRYTAKHRNSRTLIPRTNSGARKYKGACVSCARLFRGFESRNFAYADIVIAISIFRNEYITANDNEITSPRDLQRSETRINISDRFINSTRRKKKKKKQSPHYYGRAVYHLDKLHKGLHIEKIHIISRNSFSYRWRTG